MLWYAWVRVYARRARRVLWVEEAFMRRAVLLGIAGVRLARIGAELDERRIRPQNGVTGRCRDGVAQRVLGDMIVDGHDVA